MPRDLVSGMGLFPCSWTSDCFLVQQDPVVLSGASFTEIFISGRFCTHDLVSSPNFYLLTSGLGFFVLIWFGFFFFNLFLFICV